MAREPEFDRRALLQGAGLAAIAGAIPGGAAIAQTGAAKPLRAGFDFDEIYSRIGTDSTKWDAAIAQFGKDNIAAGMGIADMDFRCAPVITEALQKRVAHENWGYMTIPASFGEVIVRWNKERYGLDIDPATLEFTTGVHGGLMSALRALAPRGSKVLVTSPTYNGFYGDMRKAEVIASESPLVRVNGRYAIDFDDFERRIDGDTKAFLLCNPHNPTGNFWSREDLIRLGEICLRHGVVVLADEIHCDFVNENQTYTPFASLDKAIARNSITFKAASKSFGLSGMKCAWCFSDNTEFMARLRAQNRADVPNIGVVANQAAYAGGSPWLAEALLYIDGTLDFAERYIAENIPLVRFAKPQGTYLAWLDVSRAMEKIGIAAMAKARNDKLPSGAQPVSPETVFEEWLVRNAKVDLNPGHTYGLGGAGHMRMNLATSRKIVTLALSNMAQALNSL